MEQDRASRFRKDFMSCFLKALRRGRSAGEVRGVGLGSSRTVKFAADVSMAMSASGTTWSRSILAQSRKISPNFLDFLRGCRPRNKIVPARARSRFPCKGSDLWRTNFLSMRKDLRRVGRRRRSKPCKSGRGVRRLNASCKKSMRRLLRAAKENNRAETRDVASRIEILKGIIPGGAAMDAPLLLEEALDYIMALRMQIESMQTLVNYFGTKAGAGAEAK